MKPKQATDFDILVGERIRKRRKALGLSQSELGAVAGLSHQQIVKYEAGQNRVHPAEMVVFARALDAPVSYFFLQHLTAFAEEQQFLRYLVSEDSIELNTAFAKVTDPAKRRVILNIVDSFKELSMQTR
ncbi:helix-turn-helix transcriptional regulator [Agrobacterium rosae]|uniref:helix-turn-helix domain-containing protein n=1 Tax=Agrobacterium rosae TaxID=1972867 RepID=UPI0019D3BA49|nr:helix-turn-helix transcriptional regulator [Agrobacterium rosae]MBN7808947.1 helix-turn-helix transcriptional regulator [Agrobacterium rosae]